jgi:hypothetical protein
LPHHAAPRRAAPRCTTPRPLPCVLPLMYPTHREPTMRRDPCTTRPKSPAVACLPARLLACLPACLPGLPWPGLAWPGLACPPACLLACLPALACLCSPICPTGLPSLLCLPRRSRFARENRSLLKYIGEYEERPRRALPGEALAGKWL